MFISGQDFYERMSGEKHRVVVLFEWRGGRCYDVWVDDEFYATAEHKSGAYEEIVDIIRTFNWSPLRAF